MVNLLVSSLATSKNRLVYIPIVSCLVIHYKYHEVRSEFSHCSPKRHYCQNLRVPYRLYGLQSFLWHGFRYRLLLVPYRFAWSRANSTVWMLTRRLHMYMKANLKGPHMYVWV